MHGDAESDVNQKLIIVSNRLPITIEQVYGKPVLSPASGGLVTALNPILKKSGGKWVGWTGTTDVPEDTVYKMLEEHSQKAGYHLFPIFLTREDVELFYEGFSNEIIWPLFHDLLMECHFNPEFWKGYQNVNAKFAEGLLEIVDHNDFIWVHDYHLMLMAQNLRKKGYSGKLAFFLHIPFAPLDIFMKIPWRFELLRALLDFDFIGFQSMRDHRNFLQCVSKLLPDVSILECRNHALCTTNGREVFLGVFPISIDFNEFYSTACAKKVEEKALAIKDSHNHRKLVFSVDRLDYTKGILNRLEGIHRFLEKFPEMHRKVTFIQLVVPSRTHLPEYHKLKEEVDREVGKINSAFTIDAWVPIHYLFYPLSREDLVAHYRAADVILVTPIKDGMNLVAKEYAASNVEEEGVVILSEFAGAACQFKDDALLINPYDVEGVADSIRVALEMPLEERKRRMHALRESVKHDDIYQWISNILAASKSSDLNDIIVSSEYIPTEKQKRTT